LFTQALPTLSAQADFKQWAIAGIKPKGWIAIGNDLFASFLHA